MQGWQLANPDIGYRDKYKKIWGVKRDRIATNLGAATGPSTKRKKSCPEAALQDSDGRFTP
jgi:hypothetical protein